jgi:hypothetical protein
LKRHARQWLIFLASIIACGVSFPMMPFSEEQRALWRDNFGLGVNDADGDPRDGVEEALGRIDGAGREFHDLKNVAHEWTKARPKLAAKFFSFVIVVQFAIIGFLVT